MSFRKPPVALLIILLIGLVHGLIYLALLPPWQHYDEPTHFEYAWLLANRLRIPEPGDFDPTMRREVALSMIDHGFYRGLGYLPDLEVADGQVSIGGYSQLGEDPVYYFLIAIPIRLLRSQSVDFQLYGARFVSVCLLLVSLAGIYAMSSELTSPGSPLRWLIPGGVALLPGYVELMSAVNNDIGAAAFMSLVLWGIVRLVKRGWQLKTVVWSGVAMLLCLFTKETAYLAVPLWVIGVFLSLLGGKWRRFGWIVVAVVGITLVLFTIGWGDASRWYRRTNQVANDRLVLKNAPIGTAVFALQVEDPNLPGGQMMQLSQLVMPNTLNELKGQSVTVGAWMWADVPVKSLLPVLTAFKDNGGANQAMHTVELSTQPVFYAYLATIPANTTHLLVHLSSANMGSAVEGTVYLDGVVMVSGEYSIATAPAWETTGAENGSWEGEPVVNVIRNASAEESGPRVYPWVDRYISRVVPDDGRPSLILYSLTDYERTSAYYQITAKNLLQTFWGKFAWGHVKLTGQSAYKILNWVSLIGLLGCIFFIRYKFPPYQWSALGLLGLSILGIWGLTLVRGAIYLFDLKLFIPGARYASPVIGPTMGILCYGWWSILGLIGKVARIKPHYLGGLLGLAMLALDVWSFISIGRYYAG